LLGLTFLPKCKEILTKKTGLKLATYAGFRNPCNFGTIHKFLEYKCGKRIIWRREYGCLILCTFNFLYDLFMSQTLLDKLLMATGRYFFDLFKSFCQYVQISFKFLAFLKSLMLLRRKGTYHSSFTKMSIGKRKMITHLTGQ
jgi:hypothetical protein